MPIRFEDSLSFFQFDFLPPEDIVHGIFTRHGGVSPRPWQSLNVGGTVGDERGRVLANRERAFGVLGLDPISMFDAWQIHSANSVRADRPRGDKPHQKADILVTNQSGVSLFMRFADCVPIMLYDPQKCAVGLAHAGWLGTVRNAAGAAVRAMKDAFGSEAGDLYAGLGPSIGPDHYPVGEEVLQQFRASFGEGADDHIKVHENRQCLNLWTANKVLLEREGVRHLEVAGICTACEVKHWYSHRAEKGKTGRFGAILALKS